MPWFAWIAIIGILVWGGINIFSMASGKALPWSENEGHPEDLEKLKKRIEALESGQVRPEVERRIDRLEAKVDKRELRDNEHDSWERQAKQLGLGKDDDENTTGH